jgi:hypothetical protein
VLMEVLIECLVLLNVYRCVEKQVSTIQIHI